MLTMDNELWFSGGMLESDDEFEGLSIGYDELCRIAGEESPNCSQSIPGAVSIGQVPCDESVADMESEGNLQIQFGLQELKTGPSLMVGSPKQNYSTEHDIWSLGKVSTPNASSFSRNDSRETQYHIPNENMLDNSFLGYGNQVSDCNDDFDTICFNNEVIFEDVDFENPSKFIMEFSEAPEMPSSISLDTSHHEIYAQTDGMCETRNHHSQLRCPMDGSHVHLDLPTNVNAMTDLNGVKDNCFMENASIQVERTAVSDMSGNVCYEFEFSNDNPSSSEVSMSIAASALLDMSKNDFIKPEGFNSKFKYINPQSHINCKKDAFCVKEESTEGVAYEKPHCFSDYMSDVIITKSTAGGLIQEKDSKMSVSASGSSISNLNNVVTVNVENDTSIPSKAYSQDTLDETPKISFIIEDQNRRGSGHAGHDADAFNSSEPSYCMIDESVGKENHPNRLASHLSKVSPESTQSNSLDNNFLAAAGENDICILEEISHPVQSITHRESMVTSQSFPLGGMRLRTSDEQLVLQVALQDLSQQKSETSPPDGLLVVPLFRHQRIALSWMVHKETSSWNCVGGILADDQGLGKTISIIALLLKERAPLFRVCQNVAECGELGTLNLDEEHDSIHHDFDEAKQYVCSSQPNGRLSAGTLIVCPTGVLRQWADELRHRVSSKADLSVLIYHGSNRTKDPCELAKYDVVLTTYSIVSMEVPKQPLVDNGDDELGSSEVSLSKKRKYNQIDDKGSLIGVKEVNNGIIGPVIRPLAKVQWFRVVLDEAQSIKNYRTQVARACWGLRAKRRWCLSGTPIQNAVDDLYSYFRFLKYDPFCSYKTFCEKIKIPISRNPEKGFRKLQAVLKTIMLRRTKATLLDGEPIIALPPKSVDLRKVEFSKVERDFYAKLEDESRAQFEEYAAAGTVKQNYVNILLMLLRLRQACDHPLLVKKYNSNSVWKSSIESAKKLPREKQLCLLHCLEASLALCGICNDPPEDAVVSICGHVFCNQCICEHLSGDGNQCPDQNCKLQLNVSTLFSKATFNTSLSDHSIDIPAISGTKLVEAPEHSFQSFFASSKIKAALKVLESLDTHLKKKDSSFQSNTLKTSQSEEVLNKSDPVVSAVGEKAIVFSQWTRMLDLLEASLKKSSIQYRRLDGTMSVAARDKAVKDFNTCPEVSVMIMSLKAASLGLNMVAACHVIMMDLWWNPTTEDQAIDRAHRIGQTRPVTVVRLTVKDTVEDRILALQEKKREMVSSAFGEDGSGRRESRLTVEELKYLFMA